MDWRSCLKDVIKSEELAEWTKSLIKIPSYPGIPGQETGVASFIKALLEGEGIACCIEEVEDGRSNVTAVLHGNGTGRSLLLCGHMDTVPPYDMEDALLAREENGKIIGRGASDMKGPVAAMVGTMIALKRANIKLKGDLIFAGVIDEECRSAGTIHLLEQGVRADAAIVGEPSDAQICIAHRGLEWFEFQFSGKTVHGGSQDVGVNAILKAVDFIDSVQREIVPSLKKRTHPLMGGPTLNIGVIEGGTQLSTVAGQCSVYLDRRFLPSERYETVCKEFEDIMEKLSAADPDFRCTMKVTDDSRMKKGYIHQGLETDPEHEIVKILKGELSAVLGTDAKLSYFPAWTDAGLLSYYGGIPSVVYGPGYITCCHSKEEFIEITQLEQACLAYARTAVSFCGGTLDGVELI